MYNSVIHFERATERHCNNINLRSITMQLHAALLNCFYAFQSLPEPASVSNEDDGDHDDNDSNDTDESDEDMVTNFPTDAPKTTPLTPALPTRGDNSGRGDSVAYRMRAKTKLAGVYHKKSSEFYKAAGKVSTIWQWLPSYHKRRRMFKTKIFLWALSMEEIDKITGKIRGVDSSEAQLAAHHFPRKSDISVELDDKSNMQDSNEVNNRPHDKSMENDSPQQLDCVEADSDNSKPYVTEDSHMSTESTEQQQVQTEDLQQVDGIPEVNDSNQTSESIEDTQEHNSIEDNEVAL
uniref:Uncharacterized protein n=1 Tax=Gopherus evgoodei TaxID=1825980 RepID=A0A8C4VDD1_9SAUR